MPFTLRLTGEYLQPLIVCANCGGDVSVSGYQLWHPPDGDLPESSSVQLCGDDCLDVWLSARPDADEWVAIPIDAYLANLIRELGIDVAAVLERERAVWAAEHTRHESPE